MPVMYDAIYPSNLPAGGDAYLGYADGRWPDYAAIAAAHNVPVYALTVYGSLGIGDGVDCEPGDATVAQAAAYTKDTIDKKRIDRPIAYAMESWAKPLVDALNALRVDRTAYRLLTAHYQQGKHICGPTSCGCPVQADGTQWLNAGPYDESLIDDHFLGAASHPGPLLFIHSGARRMYDIAIGVDGKRKDLVWVDPTDSSVRHAWSAAGDLSKFDGQEDLGGKAFAVAATWEANGNFTILVHGTDNHLYFRVWQPGKGWITGPTWVQTPTVVRGPSVGAPGPVGPAGPAGPAGKNAVLTGAKATVTFQ